MKAWSVELDAAHQWTDKERAEEVLTRILKSLRRRGAAGSHDTKTISVRFDVKAGNVEEAVSRGVDLFMRAAARWTLGATTIVRVEAETVDTLERRLETRQQRPEARKGLRHSQGGKSRLK